MWVSAAPNLDHLGLILNAAEEGLLREADLSKGGWSESDRSQCT